MYKSLDSLGHQAWVELGLPVPMPTALRLPWGGCPGQLRPSLPSSPALHRSGHLFSGGCQLAEDPAELLGAVAQLLDSVHHVLGSSGRWVLQGGGLGGGHDATQEAAQQIAVVGHLAADISGLGLPRERVPDEHQLMGTEDDKLAVCHKDLGRLVGGHSGEEGVHRVGERGQVRLALLQVEEQQLPVRGPQAACPPWGQGLGLRPVGQVVVYGP